MITQEKQGSASISTLFILNYVTKLLQPISEYKQTVLEHFDQNQVEEKMDYLELIQQPGPSINNLDTEAVTIFLSKKCSGGRYSSDDEAFWWPDQQGVSGCDKKEKLAKNLLEVGKTRLYYNESEIENIVKLYEVLQELDKKAVSYGQQFKPLTKSRFGARRPGHTGVEQNRRWLRECWIFRTICLEKTQYRSHFLPSPAEISPTNAKNDAQQMRVYITLQANAQ